MNKTIQTVLQEIQSNKFKNNTQRAGYRLLNANGEWLPRSQLRIPSATSRIRDLRKEEFGGFAVECRSAEQLSRKASRNTFYYRINPNKVTRKQVEILFQ